MGKSYFNLLLWVYGIALVIGSVARTLLVLRFIDAETGFYTQQNGIILVFYLCLLIAPVFLFAASRLRKAGNDYPIHCESRIEGVLAILVGLSIVAYMLLDQPYSVMEQNYSTLILRLRDVLRIFLGFIAGLSFVLFGIGNFTGGVPKANTVPALLSSVWMVFLLVTRFNSYTTLTTISDNLLAVLFMVAATLFLMGHARTAFGFSRKDGRNYTIPAGLCTSLIGLFLVVPHYIAAAAKQTAIQAPLLGLWESVFVLLLSVYAVVFVIGMIRSIKIV